MNQKQKQEICKILSSTLMFDEPLSNHTTFGIGGPASCMVYPNNRDELKIILKYAHEKNIPSFFIGSGSNILVSDEGFKGLVISLKKTFKKMEITDNLYITSESGVMLGTLVKTAIKKQVTGLESLIGVPGTLGGALLMNAGAYGSEISNYFEEAKVIQLNGEIKVYKKKDVQFSYRHSTFPENEILIEASFQCKKGNMKLISKERKKASNSRKTNQPLKFRSAGSIFKNPSNKIAAGFLIEQVGLKGIRDGGASISEKHANFILNIDNAKATDVLSLIKLARKKVAAKFNLNLDLEIKLLGFSKTKINEIYYA